MLRKAFPFVVVAVLTSVASVTVATALRDARPPLTLRDRDHGVVFGPARPQSTVDWAGFPTTGPNARSSVLAVILDGRGRMRNVRASLPDGKLLVDISVGEDSASLLFGEGYRPDNVTRRYWETLRDSMVERTREKDPRMGAAADDRGHAGGEVGGAVLARMRAMGMIAP
jgi:hypothetical protein